MSVPANGEPVEILLGGQWIAARFVEADSVDCPDYDEIWWMDYFDLGDGRTVPEDIHSGDDLPQWRRPGGIQPKRD